MRILLVEESHQPHDGGASAPGWPQRWKKLRKANQRFKPLRLRISTCADDVQMPSRMSGCDRASEIKTDSIPRYGAGRFYLAVTDACHALECRALSRRAA